MLSFPSAVLSQTRVKKEAPQSLNQDVELAWSRTIVTDDLQLSGQDHRPPCGHRAGGRRPPLLSSALRGLLSCPRMATEEPRASPNALDATKPCLQGQGHPGPQAAAWEASCRAFLASLHILAGHPSESPPELTSLAAHHSATFQKQVIKNK